MDSATSQAAHEALEREANKFIAEVRRSLDYYLTQATQVRTIKRIYPHRHRRAAQEPRQATSRRACRPRSCSAIRSSHVATAPNIEQIVMADRMGCAPAIGLALGGLS